MNPFLRVARVCTKWPDRFVDKAREIGAPTAALNHDLVTPERVQAAHKAGLEVLCWTSNEPAPWARLIGAGVDAMASFCRAHKKGWLAGDGPGLCQSFRPAMIHRPSSLASQEECGKYVFLERPLGEDDLACFCGWEVYWGRFLEALCPVLSTHFCRPRSGSSHSSVPASQQIGQHGSAVVSFCRLPLPATRPRLTDSFHPASPSQSRLHGLPHECLCASGLGGVSQGNIEHHLC